MSNTDARVQELEEKVAKLLRAMKRHDSEISQHDSEIVTLVGRLGALEQQVRRNS